VTDTPNPIAVRIWENHAMNTPAIKPILDSFKLARDAIDNAQRATNTEERERIAELEGLAADSALPGVTAIGRPNTISN
jgi:hypothetical protein